MSQPVRLKVPNPSQSLWLSLGHPRHFLWKVRYNVTQGTVWNVYLLHLFLTLFSHSRKPDPNVINQKWTEACPQNWCLGDRTAAKHGGQVILGCKAVAGPPWHPALGGAFSHLCTRWRGAPRPGGAEMTGPPKTHLQPVRGMTAQEEGTWAPGFGAHDPVCGECVHPEGETSQT